MSRTRVTASAARVVLTAFLLASCMTGDKDPPPGVEIENRTDLHLKVFSQRDGTRLLVAEVPPHESSEAAGGPCVRDFQLVAETSDGTVVARRGPFDECNEERWIIEAGG